MEGSQLDDRRLQVDPLQRLVERVEADAEKTAELISFTRVLRRSINEKRLRSGLAPLGDVDEKGGEGRAVHRVADSSPSPSLRIRLWGSPQMPARLRTS